MRDLILTGFMGTGKTTTARNLARTYGLRLVDVDEEIERRAGIPVPAIFARDGESGFRALEREVWSNLMAHGEGRVIATGGGTLIEEGNRERIDPDRVVLTLSCEPELALRRAGSEGNRPLLLEGKGSTLLTERRPIYDLYPQIDTGTTDPMIAIPALLDLRTVGEITFPNGTISRVEFQRGGLRAALPEFRATHRSAAARLLITDETVANLPWFYRLGAGQIVTAIPPGEDRKTLATIEELCRTALRAGLDRTSTIVGMGGGVIGDLAGFVAATYLRGIALLLAPTTLLAQVDAAIGGKTGVDLDGVKNQIGAFYPAERVVIDPSVLETLPPALLADGLAEIVKIAVIRSAELLEWVETLSNVGSIRDELAPIRRAAREKVRVVNEDPHEYGVRALLNFGHTVGHAVETASGYRLSHGQAVAIGMVAETRLAEDRGWCENGLSERLSNLLLRFGLPVIAPDLERDAILALMSHDKKRRAGHHRFALPVRAGEGRVIEVSDEDARAAVMFALEGPA